METVPCNLCGLDRTQVVLRGADLLLGLPAEEFTIVRCEGCGLHYLNPRPTPSEIGRYYPDRYYAPTPQKRRTEFERSLKRFSGRVKRWILEDFYGYPASTPPGWWRSLRKALLWPEQLWRLLRGRHAIPWIGQGHLLDVGCGTGANLQTFQEQGWDVHGIEISEVAVAQGRERVGDRIHTGTLEDAPFKEEFFDVIVLSHTLEHLFSPVATLVRVQQMLQPEGMVVIAVPNADSLEVRLFGRWWVHWDPPRHLYHFGKETLAKALEKAGFRVARMQTGVGSPFFMASLERAWTHWFGRALPARKLVEKLIGKPFGLFAGHLGYGTEITVHAVKGKVEAKL